MRARFWVPLAGVDASTPVRLLEHAESFDAPGAIRLVAAETVAGGVFLDAECAEPALSFQDGTLIVEVGG